MNRAVPLVTVMWLLTGAFLASRLVAAPSGHPTADAGHLVLLLTLWMSLLIAAAFLRFSMVPVELEKERRISGAAEAARRADSLLEVSWYLLGITPFCALLGFLLTGWAQGAAYLWGASLAAMLLLVPDPVALQRLASGAR